MTGDRGAPGADSAGVPWTGRALAPQPFAGDEGDADPALAAALRARRAGGGLAAVVQAWSRSRVLVPVVALGAAGAPAVGDTDADMAVAVLTGAAGDRALPAFSSIAAMAAWDAAARPVPVEAARAAQAAVLEECAAVVVDPGSPVACVLPRPAVWAVAQGRRWCPPAQDGSVTARVCEAVTGVEAVRSGEVEPDGDAGLRLVLTLDRGLDAAGLAAVTARVRERLAADSLLRERVEGIRLSLRRG